MSRELIDQTKLMYVKYGKYINKFRSFPLIYDGLKLVERRIFISLSIEAKNNFTKSARVCGHCMGNLHPHCLAADTKIPLLDGTEPTIKWLAENKANDEFWVYSCDPVSGHIVPGKARLPRVGKISNTIYRITLDNNTVVECTDNHPFMLRFQEDNKLASYVRADQLEVGMSLRPFYITPHQSANKTYYNAFSTYSKSKPIHQIVDKIEVIHSSVPVQFYDLSVDNYSNFAISQGVFVHNSDAYGTLVQLANNNMVDQQGNFGTSIGIHEEPAAASRYTEVRMNKDIYNEAFELLKYVKEEDLEMNPEPIYLPTSLPFCLRMPNYCQGIGFGFRTYIPSYSKEDLIKRLDWLLHDKTGDGPIIKPLTDCNFGSNDDEFKRLLTTGRASIIYRGKLELDKDNKCVYVRSIPPNKKFKSIIASFKDELTVQKSIGFLDESNGDTGTKVKFQLTKRGQNLDKLYKKLQQKTTGSVTFECNMCDLEGNVICMSVDDMLLTTYEMYKNINKIYLEDIVSKLEREIEELSNMQKIKKVLPELLKKYPDDLDNLVNGITEMTQLEEKIIRDILDRYNIPKFLKAKIDIDGKKQELNTEKNNLQNLDSYVWNRYQ